MLVASLISFVNTKLFLSGASTTNGTVVKLVESVSDDSITYKPFVAFKSPGGKTIEFLSSSSSNPPCYSKGAVVEVLYQESDPEQAKINDFLSLWGLSTILGVLGFVFFCVGISLFVINRKNGNNKRLK